MVQKTLMLFCIVLLAGCTGATGNAVIEYETVETGSTGPGDALIALTPLGNDGGVFRVGYAANTHSVALAEHDLKEQVRLISGGETFRPVAATRMGGHHADGVMEFAAAIERPFIITIRGIPGENERTYAWE